MPIKKYCRLSPGLISSLKLSKNKTINVYFQEPSSICESEFIVYIQAFVHRLPTASSEISNGSILSSLHSMHHRYRELSCVLCTCVLEIWNWTLMVNDDVEREHKDARSLKNAYWETASDLFSSWMNQCFKCWMIQWLKWAQRLQECVELLIRWDTITTLCYKIASKTFTEIYLRKLIFTTLGIQLRNVCSAVCM